jgi:PAS domain S-box-containing protein
MTPPPGAKADRADRFLLGGFILLALIVGMSVLFSARERATAADAQAALLTQERLSDILSTMRQAESGLRGYMLTGNNASVATYNFALNALPGELAEVDGKLTNGLQQKNLAALHQIAAQKLQQLAQAMALYSSGQTAASVALVNTDLNLQTMQQLRSLVGVMQANQARRFAADQQEDQHDAALLQLAIAGAVLATLLLAWFAIRENRLQTAQLRSAEAALIGANEALERRIDERTRTLRESEAQFRTLAEFMPSFVFRTNAAGKNLYISPQFSAYTGLATEQTRGKGWTEAVHPDDAARFLALWRRCVATATDFEIEYRLRGQDDVYRWYLARASPTRDETGVITGWIGSCTDIEARKQAETALAVYSATLETEVAERARELDRVFRLSTDILTVGNFDGYFTSLSPAWERVTGWSITDGKRQVFMEFVHPEDRAQTEIAFGTLTSGGPAVFENRYRCADGSWRWLSWSAVSVPDEGLIYCVARDITATRERDEQLRQSQKMEVVGQLTGGVAHDFNNLLTIIMGSLELLSRSLANAEPKTLRRVEAAMDGARRAAALTHRLLAFSRRQPLAPQPVDVNRLLAGMSDMLHRTLGESIAIEIVTAAGLWPALADPNQLENAMLNLAVNARDAMAGDGENAETGSGHLTIETENTYLDGAYAAAQGDVQDGEYVQISVTDTGAGMAAETRARVFEPFFTTKPQGQGTGLGLAQVYGFIKQSGGHVAVYSEPGEGTTVKLYLPRLRAGAPELPTPALLLPSGVLSGKDETILLVEDEEGVRKFCAEILQDLGYRVLQAETAAEALRIAAGEARIDLLFTDVVLPGGTNGRVLANEILTLRPETVVLFTTGYTRNAIIHHGRLDDGVNFLGKPYTAAALGEMVQRLLVKAPAFSGVNSG